MVSAFTILAASIVRKIVQAPFSSTKVILRTVGNCCIVDSKRKGLHYSCCKDYYIIDNYYYFNNKYDNSNNYYYSSYS